MARTDYYNDPNAPEPNSVVPSASAIVTDEHGRILLVKRRDNTLWALPRGGHDIGESIEQTAVREVKEETGLDVEVTRLQHLRMRLGRKATSHHDIDRLGVASTADESVYRPVATSPPACAGQSLRSSLPRPIVTCTNHGSVSVQFTVWKYP